MKWLARLVIAAFILVLGVVGYAMLTAQSSERPVGFAMSQTKDAQGTAFAIGIWYPTQARPWPTTLLGVSLMNVARDAAVSGNQLPLVVISHGNGGEPASHNDLALALANAGYVVAAPMHTGDNYADQSGVGSVAWLSRRSGEVHATVSHLLTTWQGHAHINPERIGAFGFSAGGFTVLTSLGAQPELGQIAAHCAQATEFACAMLKQLQSPLLAASLPATASAFTADARIRAAVIAAPGLGFSMTPKALENVRVPLQLWAAELDDAVPYASNTKAVRDGLPQPADFHNALGAGHMSFLAPCGLLAPPAFCADKAPFDRKAFHAAMNADVVAFFETQMK